MEAFGTGRPRKRRGAASQAQDAGMGRRWEYYQKPSQVVMTSACIRLMSFLHRMADARCMVHEA